MIDCSRMTTTAAALKGIEQREKEEKRRARQKSCKKRKAKLAGE